MPLTLLGFVTTLLLSALATASAKSVAPTNVPPVLSTVENLGYATNDAFNPYIYRDGGGGGLINGHQIISFSDSFTTTGDINSTLTSFVHNTFGILGYLNETDPTQVYDFGGTPNVKTGLRHFKGTLSASQANETNVPHSIIAIWPNSNMMELQNGKQGLAVYSIYNASHDSDIFYNTMIVLDVPDDIASVPEGQTLNASRVVPQLFYGNENLYGSFCIYRSGASGSPHEPSDSNLYLFSTSSYGIKVARVPLPHKPDRSYYEYWDGTAWSPSQPAVDDTTASIINWQYYFNLTTDGTVASNATDETISMDLDATSTVPPAAPTTTPVPINTTTITYGPYGPGSGDIFFSPFFSTYITIFQAFGVSSSFYLCYSLTGSLTSNWSDPMLIYETPPGADPMCEKYLPNLELDYCGHAYPSWDPSGKSVLLSYSACDGWTRMVRVTFEGEVINGTAGVKPTKSRTSVTKTKSPKTSKTKTKVSKTTKAKTTTAATTTMSTTMPAVTDTKEVVTIKRKSRTKSATSKASTTASRSIDMSSSSRNSTSLVKRDQMKKGVGRPVRLSRKLMRQEREAREGL